MDMKKKVPVKEQEATVRVKNFKEVCLGYNQKEAMEEAFRCLGCKKAKCIEGCPVEINIPEFVQKVKEGAIEEAYQIIHLFQQYVDVYVRRKHSVKENVSGGLRESRFLLESWNVLWQIMH